MLSPHSEYIKEKGINVDDKNQLFSEVLEILGIYQKMSQGSRRSRLFLAQFQHHRNQSHSSLIKSNIMKNQHRNLWGIPDLEQNQLAGKHSPTIQDSKINL